MGGNATPGIAEPARRFSVSERVRKSIEVNAPEPLAGAHFVKLHARLDESRRRPEADHLAEVSSPDALGRGQRRFRLSALQRLAPRQAVEFSMGLDQEAVDGPRSSQPLVQNH